MARIQRSLYVNASEVGQAKFCPHSVTLARQGVKPNKVSVRMMKAGTASHEHFTNRELKRDSRCYIATHLFGESHWKTEALRTLRDEVLSQSHPGVLFIKLYYRTSPWVVSVARRLPILNAVLQPIINRIVTWSTSKQR